jgi:hypothetical protein
MQLLPMLRSTLLLRLLLLLLLLLLLARDCPANHRKLLR